MSDSIEKAAAEAVEAARQSDQYAMLLAALTAAKQVEQPVCHHQAPVQRQSGGAAKWVGIGVGASVLLITVAVSAVAVAISAVALTACLLILRSIWTDVRKGR